jgi:hypothetical protein
MKRGDVMNERGGSLILPWPNTMANVRKTARELRTKGWITKVEKTVHETYVWTNAPMSERGR